MRRSTVKRLFSVTFRDDFRAAWRGHNVFVLVNYSPTICLNLSMIAHKEGVLAEFVVKPKRHVRETRPREMMAGPLKSRTDASAAQTPGATRRAAIGLLLGATLFSDGGSMQKFSNPFASSENPAPAGPPQQPAVAGNGQVKVGLLLPLSASGNAGVAAQSMKNAGEMALAEFQNPNIQLLIKDDGGNPQGAQQGTQQALDEGAEIILGPLFAASVPATAQVARGRSISCIAFSTDSSIAGRGVYLLSFLPESDVNRIVEYSASIGKKSFAALLPENAYGNVVEAAFKPAVGRRGGRIVAFEKYGADRPSAARNVAQAPGQADAPFIADDGDSAGSVAGALTAARPNFRKT